MTTAVAVPVGANNSATVPARLSVLPRLSAKAARAVDFSPAEIIERWLASVSDDARRGYARALATFTEWAMPEAKSPQDGLRLLCESGSGGAHELLTAWRDELLDQLAPGTVAGRVSAIGSLLRACRRAGLIAWAVERVAPKRESVQDRSGPRRADVERLLAHLDELAADGDVRAIRDAAICRLLYCCAFRRAEVCGLRVEDIGSDGESMTVAPRRKGHRTRKPVSVSPRTAAAIEAWRAVRGDESGALFHRLDRDGDRDHLSGESIRKLLLARSKSAGLKRTVRPHGLRHSAATELARRGSLDELMALGGWKSLTSASAYLDKHDENRRRALSLVDA